jgi:hypothetical protein
MVEYMIVRLFVLLIAVIHICSRMKKLVCGKWKKKKKRFNPNNNFYSNTTWKNQFTHLKLVEIQHKTLIKVGKP